MGHRVLIAAELQGLLEPDQLVGLDVTWLSAPQPTPPGDYVALWQSDAPPDAHVWLGERGWSVEQYDAVERGAAYGLEVPAARQEHTGDRARLVDATRF